MKTLQESIIGKKGNTGIGITYTAICQSGMLVRVEDVKNHQVSDFLTIRKEDCNFPAVKRLYDARADVIIYRSGNSIRNPNYKKIESFINHSSPIWKS